MSAQPRTWQQQLNHFFYAEEVPYGLALVRMVLPLVMLFIVGVRWPYARELFSADGAPAQLSIGYGYGEMFPEFSGTVVVALMSLLVVASVTSSIGWCTRPSLIITFVLFTYFCWMDAISSTTKYTSIATNAFFLLAISPCGAVWSVDAWLANYRRQQWPGSPAIARPKYPVWSRRLLQFLIAVVYFGAGITKMQTPGFFSSDQLQTWMLTHINYRHPVGEYLSLYPALLVVFGYIVIVWEIVFIFTVWDRRFWRTAMLGIGVLFHFMTSLTLGLLIFPATCYSIYLAFVDEQDVQQAAAFFRRVQRKFSGLRSFMQRMFERTAHWHGAKWRTVATPAFLTLLLVSMGGGVGLEYALDPYGVRRPEGRYALTPIEPEIVAQMLAPTPPLRDVDKFFAIDTGTILVGDLLVDRRTKFRQGEQLIAQCHLNPPHEDLWLEMHIRDAENHLVKRVPMVATREMYRAHFQFDITNLIDPGEYSVVIETAGREVLRRPITILPHSRLASAN